jgi:hypothetical protein
MILFLKDKSFLLFLFPMKFTLKRGSRGEEREPMISSESVYMFCVVWSSSRRAKIMVVENSPARLISPSKVQNRYTDEYNIYIYESLLLQ